jgi:hypothetical protein
MNANHKRLVSLTGIALGAFAFYVKSAPSFPVIQRIIAPEYVAAKRPSGQSNA